MDRTRSDVAKLFEQSGVHELGTAALEAKRKRFADKVFWINNCHINTTNICVGNCAFCRYRRGPEDTDAFALSVEEVLDQAAGAVSSGAKEVHVVGALNPALDLEYYIDVVAGLRRRFISVYIKAYTAVEIDFISRRFEVTAEALLGRLRDAGLDCLAGGGAEIFSGRVRSALCPSKVSADRWLEIHRLAHRLGIRSNATMLFGHVESPAERADHLLRLRALQDQTGGFQSFLPLPVVDFEDNIVGGIDVLKTLAIARLVLDNVEHIKVFWPIWTVKLAQAGLSYGADDFDGTVGRYRIVDLGKREFLAGMSGQEIRHVIGAAGCRAVERMGDYATGD